MYATYRNILSLKAQVSKRTPYARAHYAVIGTPLEIPVADFSANPLVVERSSAVQFVDASFGIITRWRWTIAGQEYTGQNPLVIFDLPAGKYDVTLIAGNDAGDSTPVTKTAYITVTQTLPTADFGSDITQVKQNGYVQFLDKSVNATSRLWTVEGVGTFTDENPRVRFPTLGAKDVSLTATNASGTVTRTRGDYVSVVAAPPAPSTFRTGVLCCYGTNAANRDTMLLVENRKSTSLRLTICAFDENGNPLMQPYTVTPDIPAGRMWTASMLYSGIFPEEIMGVVVVWDADAPDDGVDGALAGQIIMYPLTNPIAFFAANAMTRVPDRRAGRTAVVRQIGMVWHTISGFDTVFALINPNRALEHVPCGSLSGTPEALATVVITSGTYYDSNGTTCYGVHAGAQFPVKCVLPGIASDGFLLKDSDNSSLTDCMGQVALMYTGDLIGIEMIIDPGMAQYCALFDLQPEFEV